MDTMKRKHQGLFPVLNDGGREPSVTVNEISSEARERAIAYTARRGYDIVHFLRTVWSIVLQQFLETDLVCFVFFDHSGVQVCEVPVSREESIPNLLERIAELRPLPSALCEETRMNTGLLIGDTSLDVNPTAVLDTFRRIQKDNQPCDCLLVLEGEPPHRLALVATTTLLSSDQATAVASTVSQVMVEMSAEDNSRTVGDLSLLSEHDQQCLVRWNNFQAPPTNTDGSILDTIRAKALSQPEATAIHSPDVIMTYHELDTISNKLAVHLRLLGVRPDILVPFLFQRCHWVIVVQLAVLKAGGAFVPLEPAHPNARLAEITKRTNCGFLLTSDANAGRAALLAEKVVCINHSLMSSLPTDFTTYRLVPLSSPSSPAYVLFTSGSTGQPKGCVVDCRAMAQIPNQAVVQSMGLSSSTRVLQFASYTFAISIFEIYYALGSGATICMPTDHDRINSLATVMDEMKITWACMTPSLLRTLDPERSPATLKRVFLGGEPVVKGEFEAWAAIVDLVYVYGASEVSGAIGFTDHQCDGNDIAYRAFPGMRFWISDALDYHKLAPVGVTGELILEGPALAQRYLDDVQSTLTAFIDPPLWRQSLGLPTVGAASRMYKTGDLFRYAHDGSVIHVGRKGTQVKIRGKRLDLGEVEFHVSKCCPNVARVIAETAAPLDANGVPALVLFLYYSADDAGERNEETTPQTLFAAASERFQSIVQSTQTKLEQTLPDHMLPSFYLPLASIPMTVTGKVDRRALRESVQKCTRRELEAYQPTGVVELVPPETVLEKALHAVFAQVLRIDGATFGVHHSFIRLGGDSLAAMRAVGLLTTKEYNVTVADILGQPTVSKLAQYLRNTERPQRASAAASAPPPFSLLAGGHDETVASAAQQCGMSISAIEDCYPCTALQQGLMISTMRVPGRYIARCVFDLARGLDLERLKAAWQQTVDANVILRTRIVRRASGDLIQAVLGRQVSAIQWQSYPTVGAYKMEDAVIPMQPGDALARFALIGDTFSGWSLGLTLHHAIFDAHSLGLLLEQTQQAYYGANLDPNLFSPFIETVQKQDGASEREFWTATFADIHAPVFPSLPHDRAVPRASTHLERTIPLLSRTGSGITLSNVARLAWAIVVSAHTDSEDVVFGVTVNGRATATAGAQDMTGPTIATVPFPVRCQKQKKVADVLEAVQSLAISMMAFEQTGLQKIRQMSPQAAAACDFQSQLIFQRPAALDPSHQHDAPPIMVGKTALHGLEDFSVFIDYVIGAYFDGDILPGYMAERMMGQFANVLQQLCAGQHDRVVGELELNAQKEPLMPAVSSWDRGLTYRELDVLSATIAQTIIMPAGVKERDRVALCFEKSVWPVLSMLAVLRAGATAVNIDPTLPPARMSAILETGLPVIEISQTSVPMTTTTTEEAAQIQWPTVQPNDVAFILFTSGSTGTPKGIVIEHRHFTTAFHHHRDALLQEIFFTWVHGGCLCIPSEEQRLSNLAGFIREHQVNWAIMTPSASTILRPQSVPGLETLVLAGEPIPVELMELWSSRLRLLNGYGPAEAFTCAFNRIEPGSHHPGLFGPMCGVVGWVTVPDNADRLAALGAVGELLIEGPTVTRGYLDLPELSGEAFIDAPEWLRKIRPGYLGRKDTQVKQVVAEVVQPQGSAAVMLVAFVYTAPVQGHEEKTQLLLREPDENFLQACAAAVARLEGVLPAHMIPTAMCPLYRVPYGATSKIDRRQLRQAAERLTPEQLQAYTTGVADNCKNVSKEPPVSAAEKKWQALWARVLGVPTQRIGRDDLFFRLGGDSLSVIRLLDLAGQEGLPHLTFQDVLQNPRLREIAALSETRDSSRGSDDNDDGPAPFALVKDADALLRVATNLIAATVHQRGAYQAWAVTAKCNPILRTRIFQTPDGSSYQAVLNSPLNWSRHETLDDVFASQPVMGLGTPLAHLMLSPGHLHLVIHHALYDGWSLSLLVAEVDKAYLGLPLPPAAKFNNFIAHVESSMQIIDLPDNPTQSNVTVASKIKLAWALVSRAYTNNSDTVTGFVSSGRTAPVAGIVKVPGPTIASVPLRIRLSATQRYEHLGLQNISQQSEGGAAACQFQTLIAVEAKEHEVQGAGERHTWFCGEKTRPGGGAIEVTATFDPEVLASEQMHRVLAQLDHFLVQIQAVSEASATTIADLDILSDEDLQQLLRWNALPLPPTPWGCNRCVHDLVHDACQRRPAAVAIEAWDGQFTYQQIDDHVADLAHRIQTLGVVRPDTFVGLYIEKSRWTVVAQLAPLQRLRELCAITKLPLILTTEDQQEAVAGLFSLPTGCTRVKPSNAMYTIATSGTTGKPKVAVIEHGCFIANIQPIIDAVGINANSRVLQFAGYGFDAMLIEHMITLLVITEMGANWAMLTASVIQLLTPTNVPTLTTLVQAGEPMQQGIVDRWASHNCIPPGAAPYDIGYATGGVTWVVDPDTLDPVPIGAEGELIIEGDIVGRGYLNDLERTAAAFIPCPHWLADLRRSSNANGTEPGPGTQLHRVYRTGDLIKLRGQRLELTEVEHHVQQTFPGALQVVAAVSTLGAATDTDRTDILLPASNPDFHKAVETTELALVERVPAYMVPSIFIPLSRVPRDNNGKVDRRLINARLSSLSRKEADGYSPSSSAASTIVAPQNRLQHDIRAIWAGVLGMADEDIGIHNSFFRIGGDSITSMQHRTISQLALHATRKDDGEKRALPSEEEADVGLDHASVFLHLEGPGVGGAESMARALAVIVETHPMLRARFEKSSDGTWRQRVTGNADQSNYRYYHHGVTSQEQITSICSASQQALDIRHGPLLIIDQFERDDATTWLFLVAHHLVIDLVSWRVVLADLEQLLTTGERPKVPPTSFLRWCQLQADYAARLSAPHQVEEDQETDISAYWGKGVTRNTHRDVDRYALILDKQTSELLLTKANIALNTQPVEIVQAALLHSFVHLFPDRPAPIIFSEGHGREPWDATIDITRTVGWFTTICPAQVSLDASEDFVTALRRTKDARRRSPANGWEHFTARYLHPQGPKTMKGMEILFNYQGRYQQLERPDAMLKIDMANQFTAGDVAPDMQRFAPIEDRLYQWGPVCERSLRQAAAQLTGMSGHIQTVSDFPLGSSHVTSDLLDETLRTMRTRLANGRQLIVQDVYPCTPIQQGMLMGYTRTPWHYEQVLTWRVVGASLRDVARLQAAWQHVVNAHPALRTVFLQTSDGHIEQLVLQDYTPVVRIHQDSSHQSHAPEPEPVSLDALKPLHELHVHTSSTSGDVVLRLHINHALVDGTSTKILRRDLVCAYEGQPLPTMMLESQSYRDYVEYMLTQAASLKSHQYWQSHLQGALPCLVPSLQGHDGSNDLPQSVSTIRSFTMELGPTEALDTFCEVHELALTVLFHVAWALVVKQYTASEDVCFGYIASARHAPVQGIDDMVGPLINMLVGRIDMPAGMTLLSVLQQYNRTYLHSLEHQHQPLAEALNAIGSTSGELFNTLLTVQYQQDPRKDAAGDPSGIVLLDEDMEDKSEYPVTLNVAVFPDRVELLFSHHTAHMSDWYAARMARCFRHALAEVLTHPSLPVGEIQVVDDSQRQQILQRNEPLADPVNTCVHHIIHQRCLDFPASAAVCSWDGEFTYEELDTVSSALAEELIDYSIGVDMTIPVLLEKSRWVPVAVLGILKTGASFVLMDASHPEARLRGLCEDVQAPLILASRGTFSKASNLAPHVVCLGERLLGEIACPHPARWSRVPVCASNAAYTVFTSGSTGKPKGAILDHSCLATAAKHLQSCMYMNSASRVLQFSSHAWDIAVADIVLTLLAGGCVCIPSEEERTGDIAAAANRMRVNWAILTPTVSRLVKPGALKHLQTLVLAGEPLSPSDLAIWHDKVRLISAYGPAECCPISTVSEPLTASSNPRDIGRPPANVAWIVDRDNHARLVPEGVVGELLLEGPTVGRGYVNNAQQTAAAFIDPPLWLRGLRHGQSSTRLYKTGDLARFTPDGRLIFVGRKDNQIKIRGQRLELGEVEAQAGIAFLNRDVTVELVGQADDAFLVAFVHPMADDHESPAAGTGSLLRQPHSQQFQESVRAAISTLREALPSYMVPTAFLPLAWVPKSPTGKTDRKRLIELAASLSQSELDVYSGTNATRRTPSTPLEAQLQDLVARVLKRSPGSIALDEDLFHIGLDSLRAMTLASLAAKEGLKLLALTIFQHPRLSQLAAVLEEGARAAAVSSTTSSSPQSTPNPLLDSVDDLCTKWKIDRSQVADVLPTTFYQRGSLDCQHLAHMVLTFSQPVDVARLQSVVVAAIRHYDILRTVFVPFENTTVQLILHKMSLPTVEIQTDKDLQSTVQSICQQDIQTPIPPGHPVTRLFFVISRKQDDNHLAMILRLHHAQYDGVSIRRIHNYITAAYEEPTHPPLTTAGYADFLNARRHHQHASTFQFWRDLLHGSTMTCLASGGGHISTTTHRHRMDLLVTSAREIPRPRLQPGLTMATYLKAAWALVLAAQTHTHDLVFAQLVSGRNLPVPDIDRIVGPCINYIPVRVTLQPTWTCSELLRNVQAQHIRTMAHDAVDFDELVARSTAWPAGTEIGTGVHFLHGDRFWDEVRTVAGVECRSQHVDFKLLQTYPMLTCTGSPDAEEATGRSVLGVALTSAVFGQEVADRVFEVFLGMLDYLTTTPEKLVAEVI
ncbi:nonribosomal peptide synthetase 12 [Aspergillus lentulus]|uniref:Nonribosomal peptide synthetase lenA n=1 Tax=Aspergillus lentulus TaxID=293939 RepID=LENA_ASPLE|nr:nonribosomal peptide synthetase 12 [Aspergillus lentulus]